MIKRKSKKNIYPEKLIKFQGDATKIWRVMKELSGKSGIDKSFDMSYPQKIVIDKTVCEKLLVKPKLLMNLVNS